MAPLFYDHLIDKSEIITFIDSSPAPENQKGKLKQLVDDIIHQGIVEFILQKLHPHQHDRFLNHLHTVPHDPEILVYLREQIGQTVEEDIIIYSKKITSSIIKDLSSQV